MSDFGTRLKRLMEQGNLTAADLATLLQTSDSTVRGWLNDHRYPRLTASDWTNVQDRLRKLDVLLRKGNLLPVPRCAMQVRKGRIRAISECF